MKTDKTIAEEHKEESTVVFDDSMKGKTIKEIDKRAGLDFKDDGVVNAPTGKKVLYVGDHRWATSKFRKRYDEIAWECEECGEMHPKGENC